MPDLKNKVRGATKVITIHTFGDMNVTTFHDNWSSLDILPKTTHFNLLAGQEDNSRDYQSQKESSSRDHECPYTFHGNPIVADVFLDQSGGRIVCLTTLKCSFFLRNFTTCLHRLT